MVRARKQEWLFVLMWAQNSAFELQDFPVVCLFLKKLLTCVGKRERKNKTISRSRNEKFGPGLISLHCFCVLLFCMGVRKRKQMSVCFLPVRGAGRNCGQKGKVGERVCTYVEGVWQW